MTPKQHVLACALKVEQLHGDQAPVYIASEIGRLALEGDADGVAMWKRIAAALDGLKERRNLAS